MKNILLFTILSFSVFFSSFGQQNGLLWKVSGNNLNEASYLFGTYHLLGSDFLKEVTAAEKAFNKADAIVGEITTDNEMAAELMSFMVMEDNSLDSILTTSQYDSLAAALKERVGVPIMMMNKLKPMGVYIMMASMEMMQDSSEKKPAKSQLMDIWVQSEGKKKGKEIFALETAEEQADLLFNSSPIDRQAQMLMEYIRLDIDQAKAENDKIVNCYKQQDLDCLLETMNSSNYNQIEKDVMLKDRNVRWIPALEELMQKNSCFVAVGALHLPGNEGLIKLLEQKGYTVEAVRSKKDL